jgi:hypothetical protein
MKWLRKALSYRSEVLRLFASVVLTAMVITWGHGWRSVSAQQHVERPFEGTGEFPGVEEKIPSYTVPPTTYANGFQGFYRAGTDDYRLGPVQHLGSYEEEHHVYKVPFRYENVAMDYWWEFSEKGVEIQAERGSITIREAKPIVSVTVVGSACETGGYNIVEWWSDGEDKWAPQGQLMKRQRIAGLNGMHTQFLHGALMTRKKFTNLDEANKYLEMMQNAAYAKTFGFTVPGSAVGSDYENTAYFRIGDSDNFARTNSHKDGDIHRVLQGPQPEPHKVVIRGGSMDIENPGKGYQYYPADYAVRLIDVVVKK